MNGPSLMSYHRGWGRVGRGWAQGTALGSQRQGLSGGDFRTESVWPPPFCLRLADWFSALVCLCVCLSALLCRFPPIPRNQHPSCHGRHARLCNPCRPGRQRLQPGAHPAHRAACPRCSVSQRGSPLPRWGSLPAHPCPQQPSKPPRPLLAVGGDTGLWVIERFLPLFPPWARVSLPAVGQGS